MVELAGLAGAGKSTLAANLVRLDPEICARPPLTARSHLANVPALVPTFLGLHWPFRGLRTKEMKRILRVRTLLDLVHGRAPGSTLLFDEGPVYMLARILMFGGDSSRNAGLQRWWRRAIAQWAATLDLVVWLEAPDDVLAARLNTRDQQHPMRGAPDALVRAFLGSYRDAFNHVLAELCVAGGPQRLTVATNTASAAATAGTVLARLRALRSPASRVPEMTR